RFGDPHDQARNLVHLFTLIDEFFRFEAVAERLAKYHVLTDEVCLFLYLTKLEEEIVEIYGLCQVLRGPGLQRADRVFYAPECGDHYHFRSRVDLLYLFEQGKPIRVRQSVIKKDDLENLLLKKGQGA